VKNFLRLSAICLFALSCIVTPGCGEPETATPAANSGSADGSGDKEGSDAKAKGSDAKADGSATK